MDAYAQLHHRFMRQPQQPSFPSQAADPQFFNHPRPPLQTAWYSNQFQYYPSSPASPQHWVVPDHLSHPIPSETCPPQFLKSTSHLPPPPPPPPPPPHAIQQISQSYPPIKQDWGNVNQEHHGWNCTAHNAVVEDWAARARAWAAAKNGEDELHHSQFIPVGRFEDQNQFHDQYPLPVDSHYQVVLQQTFPAKSCQLFPSSNVPLHSSAFHPQGAESFIPGQTHLTNESLPSGAPILCQSVHQQEVPCSYSSVTDNKDCENREPFDSLSSSMLQERDEHTFHRPISFEQPFSHGIHASDPSVCCRGQPSDLHAQSSFSPHRDSVEAVRGAIGLQRNSNNPWTPVMKCLSFPPFHTVEPSSSLPSALHQNDPSLAGPSIPGPPPLPFGSFPVSNYGPKTPSAGVPCSLGAAVLHPTSNFPGDAYGISNISERPKKVPVPNWLKEEIIKNASMITRSSLEHSREREKSIDDDGFDNCLGMNGLADISPDSFNSTKVHDDEDFADAARTSTINQEIKRILTEVLLKVTDEMLDEIATKVLGEDELEKGKHNTDSVEDNEESKSQGYVTPQIASARVLLPVKHKKSLILDHGDNSHASYPVNVLGLAYGSDEDDEIQSSSLHISMENEEPKKCSSPNLLEQSNTEAEGHASCVEPGMNNSKFSNLDHVLSKGSRPHELESKINCIDGQSSSHACSGKETSGAECIENAVGIGKASNIGNGSDSIKSTVECLGGNIQIRKSKKDSQTRKTMVKESDGDQHQSKGCPVTAYSFEEKCKMEEGADNHRKPNAKNMRNQETYNGQNSKEGDKTVGKLKEHEHARGDSNRKTEPTRNKAEQKECYVPYISVRSSSRLNVRHPSTSRSRIMGSGSSDEASDDSDRKFRMRKHHLSASSDRFRRRQVLRSPYRKHSQRRHSPSSSSLVKHRVVWRSRSRTPPRHRR